MVLHLGDDDLVAGTQRQLLSAGRRGRVAEGVGDEVDPLRRVLGEDDLVGRRADEAGDPRPRLLVGGGGLLRQRVRPPVHRGVARGDERALGVQDL